MLICVDRVTLSETRTPDIYCIYNTHHNHDTQLLHCSSQCHHDMLYHGISHLVTKLELELELELHAIH